MSTDIRIGDSRDVLTTLPDSSVHCCVTSPPYYGLRDYGVDGQMGLEASPAEFVAGMVAVFREVRRVLRDDGSLWLNIGDSYDSKKGLLGIPWRLAFGLRDDGWIIRQEIIWHKPNPSPEAVKDRPTRAHEQLFLLTKGPRYFYDTAAIAEKSCAGDARPQTRRAHELASEGGLTSEHLAALRACGIGDAGKAQETQSGYGRNDAKVQALADHAKRVLGGYTREFLIGETRNRRSVWSIPMQPYKGAHCATFPPALAEPCIMAGCPVGGTVLDPFFGAGTTGLVANRLQRDCIGIELNPEYAKIARHRIGGETGLFANLAA